MLARVAASPSKTLVVCALSFCLGVALHAFDERPWGGGEVFLGAFAVCSGSALFARLRPVARLSTAALALCVLGLWRFDAVLGALPRTQDPPAGRQTYKGVLRDEPRVRIHDTVHVMDRVFVLEKGAWRPLGASMEVRGGPSGKARYGDAVEWRCAASPSSRATFLLRNIAWRCGVWKPPSVTAVAGVSPPKRLLIAIRSSLRAAAGRLLPEPDASLLLGLLIGDTDGIPSGLRDDFRSTGTAHILAVSGYNVSRLVEIVLVVSTLAVAKRKRAAMVTAVAVFGFVLLAGAEASVARAGIMGGVGLLARLRGRRYSGVGALVCAAAAMLAAQPFALRHDVGFQLSFAAVWGLHALGPPLTRRFRFVPETFGLRSVFGETMAATLATLPISLAVFGKLPLITPVANLLVLPFIPAIMALGAAALVAGALHPVLGLPAAFAVSVALRYVGSAIGALARLPLTLDILVAPAVAVLLYVWILLLWYALTHARPRNVSWRRPRQEEFIVEIVDHGS